jgi:hypothetical protein
MRPSPEPSSLPGPSPCDPATAGARLAVEVAVAGGRRPLAGCTGMVCSHRSVLCPLSRPVCDPALMLVRGGIVAAPFNQPMDLAPAGAEGGGEADLSSSARLTPRSAASRAKGVLGALSLPWSRPAGTSPGAVGCGPEVRPQALRSGFRLKCSPVSGRDVLQAGVVQDKGEHVKARWHPVHYSMGIAAGYRLNSSDN